MSNETNNGIHSLSHTKWNCKYHIVFATKYRRKVFYEEKRLEVVSIMRELCRWKGGYNSSISMFRSCTYVCRNTAPNEVHQVLCDF